MREELDWLLSVEDEACQLTDLYKAGKLPLRVTHNDTKINNVLFDKETHRALVVIDLCKNRHPSPICTRFEHHLAGVLAPLSRTEATKPYNWFSTAKL